MRRPLAVPHDLLVAGGRVLFCAAVIAIVVAVLPETMRLSIRLACGWVSGAALYLGAVLLIVIGAPPEQVRKRASLVDLGFTLQPEAHESAAALAARLTLAGLTVVASWTLTHTVFALHYAHHYYGDGPAPGADDDRGGLAFPGDAL